MEPLTSSAQIGVADKADPHPVLHPASSAAAIGHQPLEDVGRRAIRHSYKRMRKLVPRVDTDSADEAIHKLRVATRTLRAIFETLEQSTAFDSAELHALRRRLQRLTRALGEARDLDVFLERIDAYEREHPTPAGGLRALRDELTTRREAARTRLREELRRKRAHHLLSDLQCLSRRPEPEPEPEDESPDAEQRHPLLTRHFAGGAIWRSYEPILAFEWTMPDATPETLHALRIACKRLRYVLELFEAEDDADDQAALAILQQTQDHLGQLHDDVVALATVDELRQARPGDAALAAYREDLIRDRDTLCGSVTPIWDRLSEPAMRQRLARFIAAL